MSAGRSLRSMNRLRARPWRPIVRTGSAAWRRPACKRCANSNATDSGRSSRASWRALRHSGRRSTLLRRARESPAAARSVWTARAVCCFMWMARSALFPAARLVCASLPRRRHRGWRNELACHRRRQLGDHIGALLNGYRAPPHVGADRWQRMIAACAKYPDESLIVVSSGRATTVDCVRAEPLAAAIFVGGVIAPGYDLMGESLAQGTGQLPLADLRSEINGYPRSTNEAIAAGVHYAQVGLVGNIARQFAAELDGDGKDAPRLLLSGGRGRALLAPLPRSLLAEKAVS